MSGKSLLSTMILITAVVSSCKVGTTSELNSGGGANPAELGCQGLQENFVDDGLKFDERLVTYTAQRETMAQPSEGKTGTPTSTSTDQHNGTSNETSNAFPGSGGGIQNGGVNPLDPGHKLTQGDPNHLATDDENSASILALQGSGEVLAEYKGVSKSKPYRGKLADAFGPVALPDTLVNEADCTKFTDNAPPGFYDTCVELVKYFKRIRSIISVWDNDVNNKRCFEGRNFDSTVSPEFGYCDNECGFNDEFCYDCTVSTLGGVKGQRFVCKSLKTATDAIAGFCRNTPVGCAPYDPTDEKTCKRVKGTELSGGSTQSVGGRSDEMSTVSLSGYVGATETGKVNFVVAGEAKAQVRGTAVGTIGIKRSQGVGAMWTPSGLGAPGLQVQCVISVSGIASVSYEFAGGVGADLVIAEGKVTVDVGGSASFTEAYVKMSPVFSGAGQTLDGLIQQCATNYMPLWLGTELSAFAEKYIALKVIKKSVQALATGIGLDQTSYSFPSTSVFCSYPNYDAKKSYKTGTVTIYNEDSYKVIWTHYRYFVFDSLAPDNSSEKLEVSDVDVMRPFLRDIKDNTLTGQKLVNFYNQVVVPASKKASDKNWHMTSCFAN